MKGRPAELSHRMHRDAAPCCSHSTSRSSKPVNSNSRTAARKASHIRHIGRQIALVEAIHDSILPFSHRRHALHLCASPSCDRLGGVIEMPAEAPSHLVTSAAASLRSHAKMAGWHRRTWRCWASCLTGQIRLDSDDNARFKGFCTRAHCSDTALLQYRSDTAPSLGARQRLPPTAQTLHCRCSATK